MFDAGVIEAILSIPGAFHASRELLARKKPDPKAALVELDAMRANLLTFSAVGAWFDEVKQLHQNLQNVDVALEPSVRCYSLATSSGAFNSEAYPLGVARNCWDTTKPHSLNNLIDSLGSMRYVKVEDTVIVETEGSGLRRIPRWGVQTIYLKTRIDALFGDIDRRPPASAQQIREVAENLKILADHIKGQMIAADGAIRLRATKISEALASLARDLKEG